MKMSEHSVALKLMWSAIFFNLMKIGWRVRLATDVQKWEDESTFIFEYVAGQDGYRGPPEAIACVSTDSSYQLHLISNNCYHQDLSDDMFRILNATWTQYGHKFGTKMRRHDYENTHAVTLFEFDKYVWSALNDSQMRLGAIMVMAHVSTHIGAF